MAMHRRLSAIAGFVIAIAMGQSPARADTAPGLRPVEVRIVSHIGTATDGGNLPIADDTPKRAVAAEGVTLYAVLVATDGKRTVYFSDVPKIRLGKTEHATLPLARGPLAFWFWSRIEPTTATMSNEASGRFQFEPIDYAETVIGLAFLKTKLMADVRPTLVTDYGAGVGTMRYRLKAITAAGTLQSQGNAARRGRGAGGLSDQVHRVTLRRDDTYVGYLTEMFGQPYIWASAGISDKSHQSERLEGSDCADFVVYGQRRMGRNIPYTWSGGLGPYTRLLGKGNLASDGIYRNAEGGALAFPAIGDLILFPRHVGVLVADRGTIGVLDEQDIMMHTLFDTPHEEALATSGYADTPVELRRWKP